MAAHLEPDILIVDEVLAVGDAEFQKKCLGKMREVARGGRTVLFVSHNMAAVQSLCGRAIWLDRGAVAFDGAVADSIGRYLDHGPATPGVAPGHAVRLGPALELQRFVFTPNPVMSGDAVRFTIELFAHDTARVGELAVLLLSAQETRVAIVDLRNRLPVTLAPGQAFRITGTIDKLPLVEGDYRAGVYAVAGDFTGNLHDLTDLRVVARASADGHAPYPADVPWRRRAWCHRRRGVVTMTLRQQLKYRLFTYSSRDVRPVPLLRRAVVLPAASADFPRRMCGRHFRARDRAAHGSARAATDHGGGCWRQSRPHGDSSAAGLP